MAGFSNLAGPGPAAALPRRRGAFGVAALLLLAAPAAAQQAAPANPFRKP